MFVLFMLKACYIFIKMLYFFAYLCLVRVIGIKCDLEAGLPPTDCGLSNEDYTLTSAPLLDEFPWMAIIVNAGSYAKYNCTGTIINARYVLTSAQCVQNVAYVRLGEYNLSTDLDCIGDDFVGIYCLNNTEDYEVEEKIVHENFKLSEDFFVQDLALLRLKKNIDFSYDNIGPICLPIQDQEVVKSSGKIVVWGFSEPNQTVMRKYNVWLTPTEECYKKCNRSSSKKDKLVSEYCVLKEDMYNADIGGPLMFKNKGRHVQHGVATMKNLECVFYTNVATYVDWILKHMKE